MYTDVHLTCQGSGVLINGNGLFPKINILNLEKNQNMARRSVENNVLIRGFLSLK